MIPNEYHDLVAKMILDTDIERLDAAIREKTGHGLMSLVKTQLPKRSNMDFGSFKLQRFAYKDYCEYIGKVPKTTTHPAMVWKIKCERIPLDTAKATAFLIGRIIFDLNAHSMSSAEKCAVSALRQYIKENARKHRQRKARKAKRKGGEV